MGRPSVREERRRAIIGAYARVLATHGRAGASIARVADEVGVAPGLIHHHFENKRDLEAALLEVLIAAFHGRIGGQDLFAYADAALALGSTSDLVAARAWVGLFAAALSDPLLFEKMRRLLDSEIASICRRSRARLPVADASAVLAFIIGALVFGAFAPRKAAGFAAPAMRRLLKALG